MVGSALFYANISRSMWRPPFELEVADEFPSSAAVLVGDAAAAAAAADNAAAAGDGDEDDDDVPSWVDLFSFFGLFFFLVAGLHLMNSIM